MKTKIIKKEVLIKELCKFPMTVLAKKYGVSYITFYNLIKKCFPDFKPKKGRPTKLKIDNKS